MGPSAENREFGAFLLSDLRRQVMTSNKLSIHVDTGDIFYENHNIKKNEEAAFIPKKFPYKNSFESYISQFLQAFSIDDVEKYNSFAHKNAKYLFYRFNDYIKAYGNRRQKIRHTRQLKESVGMHKIEDKSKQCLIEKNIQCVEFKNPL